MYSSQEPEGRGRLKILLKASLDSGDSSSLLQSPDTLTTAHLTGGGAVNNIQHGAVVTADREGLVWAPG